MIRPRIWWYVLVSPSEPCSETTMAKGSESHTRPPHTVRSVIWALRFTRKQWMSYLWRKSLMMMVTKEHSQYIYIYYMHIKDIGVAASSTLSDTTRWHSQTFAWPKATFMWGCLVNSSGQKQLLWSEAVAGLFHLAESYEISLTCGSWAVVFPDHKLIERIRETHPLIFVLMAQGAHWPWLSP